MKMLSGMKIFTLLGTPVRACSYLNQPITWQQQHDAKHDTDTRQGLLLMFTLNISMRVQCLVDGSGEKGQIVSCCLERFSNRQSIFTSVVSRKASQAEWNIKPRDEWAENHIRFHFRLVLLRNAYMWWGFLRRHTLTRTQIMDHRLFTHRQNRLYHTNPTYLLNICEECTASHRRPSFHI